MDTAVESIRCVVCGQETKHEVVYEKWGYPILRCTCCALGSTRIPANFDPASIYSRDYFQGGRKDGYSDYLGSESAIRKEFRRVLRKVRKVGKAGPQGKLLEVGCAYGFFLMEAQHYFDVCGIEVSDDAAEYCRRAGLAVETTLDGQFVQKHGPFDSVVMLDVIEHLPSPDQTLALLHSGLRAGGSIMISTGDWGSVMARVMKGRWRLMTPPQHLYFFSQYNLVALLRRLGFRTVHTSHPWKSVPLGLAAYQLGNRLGWRIPGLESMVSVAVPVNLFDTMHIVAVKD